MDNKREFGSVPKYEVGDSVKVWAVFKGPIGTVERVIDESFPIKYTVRYIYCDGRLFTETFEPHELTLVERRHKFDCSCGSNSDMHSDWCNKNRVW